jgi:hypothetical protein
MCIRKQGLFAATKCLHVTDHATIEGVVFWPSEFGSSTGRAASIIATAEFVVPRSIPIALPPTTAGTASVAGAAVVCASCKVYKVCAQYSAQNLMSFGVQNLKSMLQF